MVSKVKVDLEGKIKGSPPFSRRTLSRTPWIINKTMNKTMNRTMIHEPWAKPWTINQGLTLSTIRSSFLYYYMSRQYWEVSGKSKQKHQDSEPKILMTWDQPLEVNINNSPGLWPLMASFCCLFIIYLAGDDQVWPVIKSVVMYWWHTVYPDNQWQGGGK